MTKDLSHQMLQEPRAEHASTKASFESPFLKTIVRIVSLKQTGLGSGVNYFCSLKETTTPFNYSNNHQNKTLQ
ncbi:hypothetical protein Lal_00040998 [Lupinus albus]|nr:hypothetical protein Lal_00040998 [Lupinus albus]